MPVMQNFVRNWRESAFVTILFLSVFVSLIRKIFDSDIWYHMVIGREVVRQMGVPQVEFYILPRLGEPGEFHEWGFGVLYYLINQYSGYVGMALANAAIGCGILLFLYLAARGTAKTEWWQSLAVVALVLWVIEPRINIRPETILYLFVAIEIFLLERYIVHRKLSWLIPLPLLAWLLSQAHPSAIFLIGVFGMYAIHLLLTEAVNKPRIVIELGGIAVAMTVAAVINPYGLRQLLLPFYFRNDAVINSVTEFLPVMQTEYAPYFITIAAIGFMAIALGSKRRWIDIMLFCFFGYLAFKYARNIALLGIVMFVPIKNAFETWVEWLTKKLPRKYIMLCSVLAGISGIVAAGVGPSWGIGIHEENTPYHSAMLIKKYAPRGNVLNFYDLGNYLAWELDAPIFVDGRNYESNKAEQLHDAIFRADSGWQNTVESFNIQAIVTRATLDYSGEIIPLVTLLENDPEWILVGRERAGLLFLKNTGQKGIPILAKNEIWYQAIEELNETMALNPDSKETYRSLATAYSHLGDAAKQQYFYSKFLSLQN